MQPSTRMTKEFCIGQAVAKEVNSQEGSASKRGTLGNRRNTLETGGMYKKYRVVGATRLLSLKFAL